MRSVIISFAACLFLVNAAFSQSLDGPEPKTITAPNPVFPVEAKDRIYGESIRVWMEVDKKGKVTAARAFGPLAPCSNLNDPVATAINRAALAAAKETIFEPILKDGKPVEARLYLTYRLRPRQSPLPDEDRKIISAGVLNGKATSLPQPYYPARAKANRVGGTISVMVLVGEDGHVISAGALSGHPDLHESGVEAACKARFSATTLRGEPAKISGTIAYYFVP